MDEFNKNLRNVINYAWRNLAGQQAFKGVKIDFEMTKWGLEEFTLERQITNRTSCGESANRLWFLMTGEAYSQDGARGQGAVDVSDDEAVGKALRDIQNTRGYVVVRLHVKGGGAGHSYIFISENRAPVEPIDGYIYQTNVGCHMDNAFGLNNWVADAKSAAKVNLPAHLRAVGERLCGLGSGGQGAASGLYNEAYMLTGRSLTSAETDEVEQLAAAEGTRAQLSFVWAPLDMSVATANLKRIRDAAMFGKISV